MNTEELYGIVCMLRKNNEGKEVEKYAELIEDLLDPGDDKVQLYKEINNVAKLQMKVAWG